MNVRNRTCTDRGSSACAHLRISSIRRSHWLIEFIVWHARWYHRSAKVTARVWKFNLRLVSRRFWGWFCKFFRKIFENFRKILEFFFSKMWFWTGQYFRNIIFDIYSGSQILYNLKIIIFLRSKIPIKSFQIKFMSFHDFYQSSKLMPWFRNFQILQFLQIFKTGSIVSFHLFLFFVCYLGKPSFQTWPDFERNLGGSSKLKDFPWYLQFGGRRLLISVGDQSPTEPLDSLD